MSRTLEQARAKFALACVREEMPRAAADKAKYLTQAHKTPMRVLSHTLGQAAAFALAKGEGERAITIYKSLQEWLCGPRSAERPCRVYPTDKSLIDHLMEGDQAHYVRAQQEALELLAWIKRFAEAFLAAPATVSADPAAKR